MRKLFTLAAAAILGIATSAAASVDIVGDTANSTENLGNFAAKLTYAAVDDANASLTVNIKNTSSSAGYLVAFAFVNPSDLIKDVTLGSTSATFGTLLGATSFANGIGVSPFGSLDIGASVTDSWLGGGSPNGGLAVNQSATFTFSFKAASGLLGLNENSFLTADSGSGYPFLVRFRGFAGGGSDKVPAQITVVPEPGSAAVWCLLGISAIATSAWRKNRSHSKRT